jgi:hypothetical protein
MPPEMMARLPRKVPRLTNAEPRYRWLNPPDSSLVMDTVTGCLSK